MIIVCNSGPLIALAKIERFDLLKSLFGRIYISERVWEEVVLKGRGKPGAAETEEAIHLWIEKRDVQDKFAVEILLADLGMGEAETIVLAKELNADILLLDDWDARLKAQKAGLNVKGTVGVLIMGYDTEYIVDLKTELDNLRKRGFWLTEGVYQSILQEVGRKK